MTKQTPQIQELFARALRHPVLRVFAVVSILLVLPVISTASQQGLLQKLFLDRPTATAATTSTLNFQARLQNAAGAIAPDGSYNVEFKLYNVSSGGSALWTEDYLNNAAQGVTVKNGYLTVNLGSITAFPNTINWDQQLWLTMTVRGTGSCTFATCTPADAEMSPRLQLTGSAYAFKAGQLAQFDSGSGFTSTLKLAGTTTGGNQIFQLQDQGAAGTYNLLTQTQSDSRYIQNQNALAQTTSNFWISGTGKANLFNSVTGYQFNGTAGSTTSCTSGNVLQNPIIQGGIITGGTCVANGGGAAPTLQNVYNNSASTPVINLSTGSGGGILVRDAAVSVGGNLFAVQNSGGTTSYLAVTTAGATVSGTLTATTVNANTIQTNGTQRIDSSGNLSNIGTINSGAITSSSTVQGTRLISTVANGTAPLTVSSATVVTNLNADLLDGLNGSAFLQSESDTLATVTGRGATTSTASTFNGGLTTTTLNATTGINTGGTQRIDTSGNFTGGTVNGDTLTSTGLTFSGAANTTIQAATNQGLYVQSQGASGFVNINSSSVVTLSSPEIDIGTSIGTNIQVAGNISLTGTLSGTSTINATSGYKFNGTAGATTTCSGGNVLQNMVVQGGIVTGGTCVANGSGSANTSLSNLSAVNIGTVALNSTSNNLNLTTTTSGNIVLNSAGTIELQDATNVTGNLGVTGTITGSSTIQGTRLISTVATGTAPLTVTSTTKVSNLNADLLDGLDSTGFIQNQTAVTQSADFKLNGTGTLANAFLTGDGTALVKQTTAGGVTYFETGADGTTDSRADLRFTSMNNGANFLTIQGSTGNVSINNALTVGGTIVGSSTIQGTQLKSTVATGTAPLTVNSTTLVTNLNADMVDGLHASSFALASAAFIQGGNSFATTATLGTNDAQSLVLETANAARLTITSTGAATFSGALTITGLTTINNGLDVHTTSVSALIVEDGGGTSIFKVDTSTPTVIIQGGAGLSVFGNINTSNGSITASIGNIAATSGNVSAGGFVAADNIHTGGTVRLDNAGNLSAINSITNISGNWLQLTANGGVPIDLLTGSSDVIVDTNAGFGLQVTTGVFKAGSGNSTNIYGGSAGGSAIFFDGSAYQFTSLTTGAGAGAICSTAAGTLRYLSGTGNCGSSSIAYKQNVVSLDDSLSILGQLRPVSFDWKPDSGETAANGGSHDFGLIAQEVQPILPELVNYDPDGTVHGLNYTAFTPFMIRGIQQQQGEISALQGSISSLSNQVSSNTSTDSQQQSQINNLQNDIGALNGQLAAGSLTTLSVSGSASIVGNLTVNGQTILNGTLVAKDAVFDGVLTVNGHIVAKGNAPVITVGQALGVGTINQPNTDPLATVDGTDSAGTISVTSGAGQFTSGVLAHISFAQAFNTSYKAVISASNDNATDLRVYIVKTSTGFDIMTKDTPAAGTNYQFDYIVLGSDQVASN